MSGEDSCAISEKIVLPRGVLNYCQDLILTDEQIVKCFTFAKNCTNDVFKQVFVITVGTTEIT